MQLEDLERRWQELDQKLDRSLELQSDLVRRAVVQPARRRIQRWALWPSLDIVVAIGVISTAGAFLANHWPGWLLVIPSAGILVAAVLLMVGSIRQLILISEVDWSGPVADIQRMLERLRVAKIRQFKWTMLLAPLVSLCVVIVGSTWLLEWLTEGRPNLIEQFPRKWIVFNYAFGVLFIPIGYLAARILARRFGDRHWWQHMLDDISGDSLEAARQELIHWSSLQQDLDARAKGPKAS